MEHKIFELMEHTDSFSLDVILTMPAREMASMLRPMIFYNEISLQLKNFCKAIRDGYSSWDSFADALNNESSILV